MLESARGIVENHLEISVPSQFKLWESTFMAGIQILGEPRFKMEHSKWLHYPDIEEGVAEHHQEDRLREYEPFNIFEIKV